MDLFGDLPEPGKGKDVAEESSVVPESQSWDTANVDFFSDLPVPSSTTEFRGTKRKLEDNNSNETSINNLEVKMEELYCVQGFCAEKRVRGKKCKIFMYSLMTFINRYLISIPLSPGYHIMLCTMDMEESELQNLLPIICIKTWLKNFPRVSTVFQSEFFNHFASLALRSVNTSQFDQNYYLERGTLATLDKFFSKHGSFSQIEKEIKRTFTESFRKTDEEFLKQATRTKPSWKDGTTAIAVLVLQNILYIANLGDSKAILCRYNKKSGKHVAIPLSTDHSPAGLC
ncbi:hypothetical protein CEXT_8121 [Caerostris extrusa]|uniref:PPM-type phosphatase domain-containing protein n=1 Tax=Caerostris extrusa TaxID=172846 RepID=A0AAV4QVW2_CAEEX|nr:hypothetical protein CEXT_8121 [Caerostris extrusa]